MTEFFEFDFCISPSQIVLPPGQLLSARGPSEVNRPSWSAIDRRVCCWGSFGHWENMQTPHRKAREIAHLSTEGLGRTCPPVPIALHARIEPRTLSPCSHAIRQKGKTLTAGPQLLQEQQKNITNTHTHTHTLHTHTHTHTHTVANTHT